MNCTRCDVRRRIDKGDLNEGERAALRERCLRCNPDAQLGSCVHWDFGGGDMPDGVPTDFLGRNHPPSSGVTRLAPDTEDALRILLARFAQLDRRDAETVWTVLRGGCLEEMARRLKLGGRAAMLARIKRARANHTWLGSFYAVRQPKND